ncbi:hypothetical protein CU098_008800, partial [Rhizopus stolonifer]
MVTHQWREYSNGLAGGPAVKDSEETYSAKWPKNRSGPKFFTNRLVLHKKIA